MTSKNKTKKERLKGGKAVKHLRNKMGTECLFVTYLSYHGVDDDDISSILERITDDIGYIGLERLGHKDLGGLMNGILEGIADQYAFRKEFELND